MGVGTVGVGRRVERGRRREALRVELRHVHRHPLRERAVARAPVRWPVRVRRRWRYSELVVAAELIMSVSSLFRPMRYPMITPPLFKVSRHDF